MPWLTHDPGDDVPLLNLNGAEGESIFWRPLAFVVGNEGSVSGAQAKLDHVWAKTLSLTDDRAVVLVGALLVENATLEFLATAVPNRKEIETLTFARQIRIAQALGLCPPRFLRLADSVRVVRNTFAHRLDVDNLETLPDGEPIAQMRRELSHLCDYPSAASLSNRELFQQVVSWIVLALDLYGKHVRMLNAFLHSYAFVPALKAFASQTK